MSARAVERVHPSAPGRAIPRWYLPLANLASLLGIPAIGSEALRMSLLADLPTPSAPFTKLQKIFGVMALIRAITPKIFSV
jgi:hypothetical protein